MSAISNGRDPRPSRGGGGATTSTVEFVETAFPLVLVRLPYAMSTPELHVLFAGFDRVQKRVLDRRALYYVVIDGLALAKLPTPLERKMLTDWMNEPARNEVECQFSLGSAVAMSSRPVRAVLTALNWIRRPPKPQVVVETVVEAIDAGLQHLRDAGVALSPAMQNLRAEESGRARASRR